MIIIMRSVVSWCIFLTLIKNNSPFMVLQPIRLRKSTSNWMDPGTFYSLSTGRATRPCGGIVLESASSDDTEDDAALTTNETLVELSEEGEESNNVPEEGDSTRRRKLRQRVADLARTMVLRPVSRAYNMPQAIAEILKEATVTAVDIAVDEVFKTPRGSNSLLKQPSQQEQLHHSNDINIDTIVDDAFAPMEQALADMEKSLAEARKSFRFARSHAYDAMEVIQATAIAQAEAAVTAVTRAEEVAERQALVDFYASTNENVDTSGLKLEDVDFTTSGMAPPFLDEDQCLVPGEPVVRVEKAPENSRRIFAGIDIMESADVVWNLLTDYDNLAKVVPSLLVNHVVERYEGSQQGEEIQVNKSLSDIEQCHDICERMKGAKLRQVGGAKVAGINFSARTTLEVREWPQGLPDFAHFDDEMWQGKSRRERANDMTLVKLEQYRFPRPFAISKLPTRDISMQSIPGDDGEFRMYQGVWRMQPLPGCSPDGQEAMRLTYAVEVSPRAYLPVQLIEGRIVKDLCTNLKAIRDYVEKGRTARTIV